MSKQESSRKIDHPVRLFVIGDSISIHYGPYLEKYLPETIHYDRKQDTGSERAEDNLDIHRGANGGDSSMVLAYLKHRQQNTPIEADVLMFNCGLHDIKLSVSTKKIQVSLDQYERNLKAIIELGRKEKWKLIWMRTTPVVDEIHNKISEEFHRYTRDLDQYNFVADRVMKAEGVQMVDLYQFTQNFIPEGICDHVHYSEHVRELQGAFLAGVISATVSSHV